MYDVVIRGGTIVDGSGGPSFSGDVAVRGDKIAAVGGRLGPARREIDADGALVTPGFCDLHTHYDGQASWDAELAPSTWHGVTTLVMGNCGVGFAPVRTVDRDRLIALMEGVEDIPGSALAEGLTWKWSSFPEYMDALDAFGHAADIVCQVPHDALRVYVMGERAVAGAEATNDDLAEMTSLLADALRAGAAGFTTGRTDTHRTASGEWTPASEASQRELTALAAVLKQEGRGVLQAVNDFDFMRDAPDFDAEFGMFEAMVEASGGRPLSISLLQRDQVSDQWRLILQRLEGLAARGYPVRAQVAARAIGVLLGLEATFHPFMGFPSYKEIAHLSLPDRVAALRDPGLKARILAEKSTSVAGDGSPLPRMADDLLTMIDFVAVRAFRLGARPDYEPTLQDSLFRDAERRGVRPLEAFYDALLDDEGQALLYFPFLNYTGMSLETVGEMLAHPLALAGLSDGGAHVGTICDASFPTFMLSYWARDRGERRMPIESVVKMQARDTARHIGLHDRGELMPGQRADINIIDLPNLQLHRPELKADLPAGGKRLLQRADGFAATLVAGEVVRTADGPTGVLPGRVVRAGMSNSRRS